MAKPMTQKKPNMPTETRNATRTSPSSSELGYPVGVPLRSHAGQDRERGVSQSALQLQGGRTGAGAPAPNAPVQPSSGKAVRAERPDRRDISKCDIDEWHQRHPYSVKHIVNDAASHDAEAQR